MGPRQGKESAKKKRMRAATAEDGRRPWENSSSSTGNAEPAARFTGQNVREPSQPKLEKVVQFMLRPSGSVHRVGRPGAGPRWVAQVRHWLALRAATTGRDQGDSGGQAQRAAEVDGRRAVVGANNSNWGDKVVDWHPCTRRPELGVGTPGSVPGRAWG